MIASNGRLRVSGRKAGTSLTRSSIPRSEPGKKDRSTYVWMFTSGSNIAPNPSIFHKLLLIQVYPLLECCL